MNTTQTQTAVEYLIKEFSEILGPLRTEGMTDLLLFDAIRKAKQMEKEQREKDFIEGYKKRAEVSNLVFDEESELFAKSLFKENFKTK